MGSFEALCRESRGCIACAGMAERTAILSRANGPVSADVMFIAEAPGRLGADRTGIPLSGDASGRNFLNLLESTGIDHSRCFITNAVLCNPRSENGNNRRPKTVELKNCLGFLRRQIELVDPAVVVTLGAVALESLGRIEAHDLQLAEAVAHPLEWFGRILWPLYHPAPRAMMHRSKPKQIEDYSRLRAFLEQRLKASAPILDMAGRQT